MDRLAYQNMTIKHKVMPNQPVPCAASLNRYSQPTGEVTSKSKINARVDDYHLERQSKNTQDYESFVAALNGNIVEDQYRTTVNNDRYFNKPACEDNFQRVYHPTLMTEQEQNFCNADRCGLGTRDRQMNAVAINKNTTHQQLMTPLPKLNYPHGYDHMEPLRMDLTSQLETQFSTLTNSDMEEQISQLNKNNTQPIQPTIMCPPHIGYNPQADHMNQQLAQLAQQLPPQTMYDCTRMLDFQRPLASNSKMFQLSQPHVQVPTLVPTSVPISTSMAAPAPAPTKIRRSRPRDTCKKTKLCKK